MSIDPPATAPAGTGVDPSGPPEPPTSPSPADGTEAQPDGPSTASADELRRQARRRRELDALFGDVLPEVTQDETGARGGTGDRDRWYSENRPPHHG